MGTSIGFKEHSPRRYYYINLCFVVFPARGVVWRLRRRRFGIKAEVVFIQSSGYSRLMIAGPPHAPSTCIHIPYFSPVATIWTQRKWWRWRWWRWWREVSGGSWDVVVVVVVVVSPPMSKSSRSREEKRRKPGQHQAQAKSTDVADLVEGIVRAADRGAGGGVDHQRGGPLGNRLLHQLLERLKRRESAVASIGSQQSVISNRHPKIGGGDQ